VGPDGVPRSVTLLSESGLPQADQLALSRARGARFEPLDRNPAKPPADPLADLSRGRMVFHWRTVPPPGSNAPPVSP